MDSFLTKEPLYNIEPDIHTIHNSMNFRCKNNSFTYSILSMKTILCCDAKNKSDFGVYCYICCIKLLNFHLNDFILIKSYDIIKFFHFTNTMVFLFMNSCTIVLLYKSTANKMCTWPHGVNL